MAIAAIVAHTFPNSLRGLDKALRARKEIVETRISPPDRIAATVEASSANLTKILQKIQEMDDILSLELVYVNYEDDLDADGSMPCPPVSEFLNRKK